MIKKFRGEYSWLSNFQKVKIEYLGEIYDSVEHAYISAKSDDEKWKLKCLRFDCVYLKRESQKLSKKKDWDIIKLDIMKELLIKKFNKEPFRQKLIDTDDMYIQEGNTWNDVFWGFCIKTDKGENNLGKLIMGIRDGIK
jgi:ribA/ribD-fused uncharacterized protein